MKKLLLLLIMCIAAVSLVAQNNILNVSGYVTDSASGAPVPNYSVHIDIDSASGGFYYHHVVFTMSNGFYTDTIFFNPGNVPTGIIMVSTWDCMQHMHYTNFAFRPGNLNFTKNFPICVGPPPPPCHADFYPGVPPPPPNPLAVHFINISVGVNGPWNWLFGDGTTSTLFDPIHVYSVAGLYQVTLNMGDSTSNGCFSSVTHAIHVGDSTGEGCHAEFTWYCDSNMMLKTIHFINQSIGTGATWNWSFGDSSFSSDQNPTHTYANDGIFHVCLTITTTNPQCTDTRCHDLVVGPPPPPGCASWFNHMPDWLHISFEGHMPMDLPATYAWTFGDGTGGSGKNIDHTYTAPGIYSVTLTTVRQDSVNCTFTSTQQILVGDSLDIHQVYGQVIAGNFPMPHGVAMIFSDDTMPGGMPFFAMSPLDSTGIYMFPYVPNGEFVIWAVPFDSIGGYLPTYYQQALYWELATKINLGQPANPYNIHLLHAGSMLIGPGGINGHVNTQGLKSTSADEISMLLSDEQGNFIGFRRVNASGTFNFNGMAYGTYYLKPELPNVPGDQVKVVLSATNQIANVTMTFNGNSISGVTELSSVESFTAYPVPVKDVLSLNVRLVNSADLTAEIYNFTGQKMLSENLSLAKGENLVKLDMSSFSSGFYILKITSAGGIKIVQKIMKQ
jgi:PKD repeat protein